MKVVLKWSTEEGEQAQLDIQSEKQAREVAKKLVRSRCKNVVLCDSAGRAIERFD